MTKIFATLKPQREFELCSTHLPPTPNNLPVTMTLKKFFFKKLASEPLCWLYSTQCPLQFGLFLGVTG